MPSPSAAEADAPAAEDLAEDLRLRQLGIMLLGFLDAAEVVCLGFDGESFNLSWLDKDGRRRACSAPDAHALLARATGVEPAKVCKSCFRPKPAGEFSREAGRPDGLCRCCKTCERIRLHRYDHRSRRLRKASARAAAAAAQGTPAPRFNRDGLPPRPPA